MVTMVTLLALSPLLALPVQTTSLTSSPNSPNFGNGDHVLTKRSIIPLIKGAADYWLRSGLDSTSFFLLCTSSSLFRLAEINATPGRLVWVQINGVPNKRDGKARKKEPLTVFGTPETPSPSTAGSTVRPSTRTTTPHPRTESTISPMTAMLPQTHSHTVHIVEPVLPPSPTVVPVLPVLHPVPSQSISIHPVPSQSVPIHPNPSTVPPTTPHPVHQPPTFLRLPRRTGYPGEATFYQIERSSKVSFKLD